MPWPRVLSLAENAKDDQSEMIIVGGLRVVSARQFFPGFRPTSSATSALRANSRDIAIAQVCRFRFGRGIFIHLWRLKDT